MTSDPKTWHLSSSNVMADLRNNKKLWLQLLGTLKPKLA